MSNFNRRNFIRAGSSIFALPYMSSLINSRAEEKKQQSAKRMICLGMGYGVTNDTWFPDIKQTGADYELTEGLKPLERHKKDFTVFQNFTHQFSVEAHWGSTFYLTGANRYAKAGSSFHNSISLDQVAAATWGKETRYTSIQLDTKGTAGHGDGLSMSWNAYGKPMAGYNTPLKFYNALFGASDIPIGKKQQMIADKRSAIDAALSDLKSVNRIINKADKDKLNEYLQSVREIELRLAKEESWLHKPKPKATIKKPSGNLLGKEEIKIMYDLMVAAFQTDSTRVITYRLPIQTLLRSLGTKVAAHDMSHYTPGPRKEASQMRDNTNSELLAHLLDKLKSLKNVNGEALLNDTTIIYGSNIRSIHFLDNCPTIVAGNTNSLIQGQHRVMRQKDTRLCNLWLTLLQSNGISLESFGDSNGIVSGLRKA